MTVNCSNLATQNGMSIYLRRGRVYDDAVCVLHGLQPCSADSCHAYTVGGATHELQRLVSCE